MEEIILESSSNNEVDEQEQAFIVAEANRIGVRETAKKHGLTWQRVASWKRMAQQTSLSKIIIQSPLGVEISAEEILLKAGNVDKIYVRIDENKSYWVKGKKSGSIDLF